MVVSNIFIAGMEKCGTTALSEWMVTSGLAQDREPEKEPYLFANNDPHPVRVHTSDLPLLDASVGYAGSPAAIARLPEYDTQIVICLRNQFERSWSSYKMKTLIGNTNQNIRDYWMSYQTAKDTGRTAKEAEARFGNVHRVNQKFYPRRSHGFIEQYGNKELEHLRSHDFASRIEYELSFYLSRRTFPLFSVIADSMFYFPLRSLLEKYLPTDVSVISVSSLDDAQARRRFVEGVFGKELDTPQIPFVFSSAEIEIGESKPDFSDKAFDMLRACFRYDLAQARGLIAKTRFGDELLNNAALDRYLDGR
jgi:hypothetical protein